MILTKQELSLVRIASEDETRAVLHGLCIEADGTVVATDSYRLMALGRPEEEPPEQELLGEQVIIPRPVASLLYRHMRLLEHVRLSFPKPGSVKATIKREGNGFDWSFTFPKVEGQYAIWQRAVAKWGAEVPDHTQRVWQAEILHELLAVIADIEQPGYSEYGWMTDQKNPDSRTGGVFVVKGLSTSGAPFMACQMGMFEVHESDRREQFWRALRDKPLLDKAPT